MSTANRVIKNTGFLYARMGITMFISFYITRLILNSLGASDFGIFQVVGGSIAMLGFLNSAMASATQRFMSYSEGEGDKEKQKRIFNISLLLHFGLSFVVCVALLIAGHFFFHGILNLPEGRVEAAQVVYGSLIVSTMFTVMSVPYAAMLNAHENMRYYAAVGILESLLKLGVAFATVYTLHDKLIVYGILMACVPLVSLTVMRVYCHTHYKECVIAPRKYWDKSLMKEMTSFAGWNLMGNWSGTLVNQGYAILANNFFGAMLNAAIGIANDLCGKLQVFTSNMLKAFNPVIVKKEGEGDHKRMMEYSYTGCKVSFLLFAFFCLPCIVEAPYIMRIWLENIPEWAILFFRYQILKTLLECCTWPLNTALGATGKIKEINFCSLVFNVCPLIVLWIVFAHGGTPYWYYPVIIFFVVILNTVAKLYYCRKYCSLLVWNFTRRVIVPCLSTGLLLVGVGEVFRAVMNESFVRFLICCVAMSLFFMPLTYYYIMNKEERQIIGKLADKIKSKMHKI